MARQNQVALAAGLLFGLGLALSGMMDPAKVQGFLDVAGDWDPSLALVMAGAIPVAAIGFARRPMPAKIRAGAGLGGINGSLLLGAALFGLGWGLAGYCPGPALGSLGFGLWQTSLFVLAMLGGMALFDMYRGRATNRARDTDAPGGSSV